ncbi:SulP family inorganic anion transporter [Actinophytocola oryzae]|uniref:Carbonic anhydrase n=1 Tax=Actinophytocola oryzae TaxID=502181 RepID=A0A4V3FRT4_9PSEU|nr:bifunctional SulP family inorganic anion transporter/carbonic anhydrase [Actinophytocola oryzae]TDV44821.1 carbonic anhydrase [Actinophytocola oryzae]
MIEPTKEDLPPPTQSWVSRVRNNLKHDLPASLVVFLVAVPMSLGIAFASGAPLISGLIAAVVGGIVAGLLGGSPLQVSGPTAGQTVIIAEAIQRFGWAETCAITVLAGVVQVVLGKSRVARGALAISPAIVHGMLGGIGITIVLSQLHVVLGGDMHSAPLDNLIGLPAQVLDASAPATTVGLLTVGLLVVWPRLPAAARKVPGPLAAVVGVTVFSLVTGMTLDRVAVPDNALRLELVPSLPDGEWTAFIVTVFMIAAMASIESLLSAVAADKLHGGPRADLNRELVGQGTANIVSGGLGGLPVTGVIIRSSTNISSGARTRASTVLHGVWILLFVICLAGVLRSIPLAALAGLLVYVGARLVDLEHIRAVRRHGDLLVYLVTLGGVVFLDLMSGVLLGLGVAALLTLRRLLWTGIRVEGDGDGRRIVVEGAFAAVSIPRLTSVLATVPPGTTVTLELVVDYLDHAAFDTLSAWQQAHERTGGTVIVEEPGHPWFAHGKAGTPTVSRTRVLPRWFAPWSEWERVAAGAVVPAQRSGPPSVLRGTAEYERHVARFMRPTLRRLADAHKPATLFLTCGDARIVPNVITSSGPGDLFTVRNIGNLVPAGTDSSVAAAVEFAVGTLGVREIAVCGHSSCGAMRALIGGTPVGAPALRSWLRHGLPSLDRARTSEPVTLDGLLPEAEWDRLALHNVLTQLDRLSRHPTVATALERGEIRLIGMYFDVASARVHLYDEATNDFRPVSIHSGQIAE